MIYANDLVLVLIVQLPIRFHVASNYVFEGHRVFVDRFIQIYFKIERLEKDDR